MWLRWLEAKMALAEQWQLAGSGPECYERFAVGRHMRPIAEEFVRRVPVREGDRVLDAACGTGIVARLLCGHRPRPRRVTGLDLNADMLAVARRIGDSDGLGIEWRQGDLRALPFADAQFEVVMCQQGLPFVADKPLALREMRRVLVPGGRLALNVFGAPSRFHAALARGLAKFGDASAATISLAPFALAAAAELRALIGEADFDDIQIETVSLSRRVEPTQEWLLQFSSALPYAPSVAAMSAAARAEMLREIAAELKGLWVRDAQAGDSFVVPCDVHFVLARTRGSRPSEGVHP
jgi:ubiquinone/menaquinone biosynthesis C-methylase UbiE